MNKIKTDNFEDVKLLIVNSLKEVWDNKEDDCWNENTSFKSTNNFVLEGKEKLYKGLSL